MNIIHSDEHSSRKRGISMADRRTAREHAYILIFEQCFQPDMTAEELYVQETGEQEWEHDEYTERIFTAVSSNLEKIDGMISAHAVRRSVGRISKAALSGLRLSIAEMLYFAEEIPFRVSINEAVELIKKYDEPKTAKYANGVLNAIAGELGLRDSNAG